ncbi:MAG: hypothetical protein M1837_005589 [Sclerophora amabilis]|nr:MAG: hypothetical protein M1837_005589 [Sclerophora amabilis]
MPPANPASASLASVVTSPASLPFIRVALDLDLYRALVELDRPATSEDVLHVRQAPEVPLRLIQDTLLILSGLGLVDLVKDDTFMANDLTKMLASTSSAADEARFLSTESVFASAFTVPLLLESKYQNYPFEVDSTPYQHAYQMTGQTDPAREHDYATMDRQGRMSSSNTFIGANFGTVGTMSDRVRGLGYDLDAVMNEKREASNTMVVVDVGVGPGKLLLELKETYPWLQPENLVLQQLDSDVQDIAGLTTTVWDFRSEAPQPQREADIYNFMHIFQDQPDPVVLAVLRKTSDAMKHSSSRILIHEFSKNSNNAKMHATMITLMAGRLRSSSEWGKMAVDAGLEITFEKYPDTGEGIVEMRRTGRVEVANERVPNTNQKVARN